MENNTNTIFNDKSKPSAEHGESLKVNLSTGRLLYMDEGLSAGANSYKISATPVYNSKLKDTLSEYISGMPLGWKLDAHQLLISEKNNTYKYIDGAGYIHNFTVKNYAHGTDEEGQGLTLTIGSGRFITDRQGNRLEFDTSGRLVKFVSAKHSSIRKVYQYTDNLLTKIYDGRKASVYLQLAYKNGLLSGIHAVENGTYKKSVSFEYNTSGQLEYITDVCGTLSKNKSKFSYDGEKLKSVEKKAQKAKVNLTYDGYSRVKTLESGYVSANGTFNKKSSLTYNYNARTSEGFSYRTEITNADGITLSYYFNSEGEALSMFERTSNGLLTTEREQGELLYTDSGSAGVNGIAVKSIYGTDTDLKSDEIDLTDKGKYFAVTMWVKHVNTDAKMRIRLSYRNNGELNYAYADIDGKAYDAWQYVSIPIELTEVNNEVKISDISLSLYYGNGVLNVTDCRIVPSSVSTVKIGGAALELRNIASIILTGSSNRTISCDVNFRGDNFVTYNDIYSTLLNMAHNKTGGYYDFIYCNGKKSVSGVSGVKFQDADGKIYTLSVSSSGLANVVSVTESESGTTSNTVNFGAAEITSTMTYSKNGKQSSTEQVVKYCGDIVSEKDEYGVVKKYEYNAYGDVKTVKLIASDGKTIILQSNEYDSISEYVINSSSGCNSENYSYVKPFDTLDRTVIREYNFGSDTYSLTQSDYKYSYDEYGEKLKRVTATGGSGQVAENKLTYIDEKLATVSDGASKYYFDSYPASDLYIFGVYEYYDKIQLQRSSKNGKTQTNTFYRTKDSATDTFVSTYDNYGRLLTESYNGEGKVDVYYKNDNTVSKLNGEIDYIWDGYTGQPVNYYYNEDGTLQAWDDNNFKVETKPTGKTYTFNGDEAYNVVADTDYAMLGSPRIIKTIVSKAGTQIDSFTNSYTYNELGLLKHKSIIAQNCGDYEYAYKTNGTIDLPLIETVTYDCPNNRHFSWNYDYDGTGNIKTITETVNGTVSTKTFTYDKFGRLTKEGDKSYVYDSNGRLVRNGSTAYYYDVRGRLRSFGSTSLSYDNYGNRTKKGSTVYNYTRGNLLESISGVASYKYSYNGIRYSKTVNGVTTTYHYDGNTLIGEDRSDGVKLRYFYDAQGVCGFRYINGNVTQDITYVKNILGDIEFLQDSNGNIVGRYTYDAWGNCTVLVTSEYATINPFRYRGYYYDVESKLYYLITRYYDPYTANFLTMDSVEYLSPKEIGGIDLYAYCLNNPVTHNHNINNSLSNYIGNNVAFNENVTTNIIFDLSFNYALRDSDRDGAIVSWLYFKAIYASGGINNFGYTKDFGFNLINFQAGVTYFGLKSPKFFSGLGLSDDSIFNPHFFFEFHTPEVNLSAGLGVSGDISFISAKTGLVFGDNIIEVSLRGYVGYGFSWDLSKGFKRGANAGPYPIGFEISISIDWIKLIKLLFGGK